MTQTVLNKENVALKELEFLQACIARYDGNGLKIKGWSLLIWSGICSYAIANNSSLLLIAAVVSCLCFWLVELNYRVFQNRFIVRVADIEQDLANNLQDYQFGLDKSVTQSGEKGQVHAVTFKEFKRAVLTLHVALLYFFQLGGVLLSYVEIELGENAKVGSLLSNMLTNVLA